MLPIQLFKRGDPYEKNAAELLYRMAAHAKNGLSYDVAFRRGKTTPGKGESLFCIEGVTTIGPTTAAKVLKHFGSTLSFMSASVARHRQDEGGTHLRKHSLDAA